MWWSGGFLSARTPRAATSALLEDFAVLGRAAIWACTQPCHTRNGASLIRFCGAHLVFSILWASLQLCCCFHWGAGSFLFLSPGGFDQQQEHFVLGMAERKVNVSVLEHLEISFCRDWFLFSSFQLSKVPSLLFFFPFKTPNIFKHLRTGNNPF